MTFGLDQFENETVSMWVAKKEDGEPSIEHQKTVTEDFEANLSSDIENLVVENIAKIWNAKERSMKKEDGTEVTERLAPNLYSTSGPNTTAYILRFRDDEYREVLEDISQSENNRENFRKLIESYVNQNSAPHHLIFISKFYMEDIDQSFVSILSTNVDETTYDYVAEEEDEEEVARKITQTFDDNIPNRLVYPFFDTSENIMNDDEVKLWQHKELDKYFVNFLDLEMPPEPDETLANAFEETTQKQNFEELKQSMDDRGADESVRKNSRIKIELGPFEIKTSFEELSNSGIKRIVNRRGDEFLLIEGKIEAETRDGEIDLEEIEEFTISADDIDEFIE